MTIDENMAMDAWGEVNREKNLVPAGRKIIPVSERRPSLKDVLAEFGPMPSEALFLGVAADGLPVLLNLHDPLPGPVLVAGDKKTGKTAFLQNVAGAIGRMHQPENVQLGVLTNTPNEWIAFENIPNNVGIFPFYHQSSEDFILSLASWAHGNKTSMQSVVILLDDLEAATNLDFDAKQNLRWLFLRGPARRVWPIVTLDPEKMGNVMPWLDAFHTRIFAPIRNVSDARNLGIDPVEHKLLEGAQFALREGGDWLKFWIPSPD